MPRSRQHPPAGGAHVGGGGPPPGRVHAGAPRREGGARSPRGHRSAPPAPRLCFRARCPGRSVGRGEHESAAAATGRSCRRRLLPEGDEIQPIKLHEHRRADGATDEGLVARVGGARHGQLAAASVDSEPQIRGARAPHTRRTRRILLRRAPLRISRTPRHSRLCVRARAQDESIERAQCVNEFDFYTSNVSAAGPSEMPPAGAIIHGCAPALIVDVTPVCAISARSRRDLGRSARPPGHAHHLARSDCRRLANHAHRRSRMLALPRQLRATMTDIMVRAGRHGTMRARATLHGAPPLAHARVGQAPRRASFRSRARSNNLQLHQRRGRRSCAQSTAADGCCYRPAQRSRNAKRADSSRDWSAAASVAGGYCCRILLSISRGAGSAPPGAARAACGLRRLVERAAWPHHRIYRIRRAQ